MAEETATGKDATSDTSKRGKGKSSSGFGKKFVDNQAYIVGQLTRESQATPQHPEWRPSRRKFYGSQMTKLGITTTAEFFEKNPLEMYFKKNDEWWYIYEENTDGNETYFDKGQYLTQGRPSNTNEPKSESKPFEFNSSQSLSDQLSAIALNTMAGGNGGSKETLGILLQKMQQEVDYLKAQLERCDSELQTLRSENMNLKIQAGQYEAKKESDIAIAVQAAKLEQEKADTEIFKQMMDEEKQNAKGGLSGLFSSPETLATMMQHAPTFIAAIKEMWTSARSPQQQQQPQQPQYGPNGEPLHNIPSQLPQRVQ